MSKVKMSGWSVVVLPEEHKLEKLPLAFPSSYLSCLFNRQMIKSKARKSLRPRKVERERERVFVCVREREREREREEIFC